MKKEVRPFDRSGFLPGRPTLFPRQFLLRLSVLALFVPLAGRFPLRAEEVSVQWLGQSCFLVTTPDGVRVLMDPVANGIGYDPAPQRVDVVTISHEHADHTNVGLAQGPVSILRGLSPGGKDWNRVEMEIGDTRIFNVASYHDAEKGGQRGLNSIFVVALPNFKLVHLGDLGHLLDDSQIQPLHGADVLLVPVGGFYTIDAEDAGRVVNQLQPKYVVMPMHYKTPVLKIKELAPADAFLKGREVVRVSGNVYKFNIASPPKNRVCVVLNYK